MRKSLMPLGRMVFLIFIILTLLIPTQTAKAVAVLTIQTPPLSWNVIGLDSNNVSVGPNHFPVGTRVCNTGDVPAANVTATLSLDQGADPYDYVHIRPGTSSTLSVASLSNVAPNNCYDFYFEVEVDRVAATRGTTEGYVINVTSTTPGVSPVSTPSSYELFVEFLVSQNRNAVQEVRYASTEAGLAAPSALVAAGGTMNLMVGNTYYIQMNGYTATQGYEQLESFINFPNTIFQFISVITQYSADSSSYVTTPNYDKLYADACFWENDKNSPNYRSCLDVGKAGGNISITYQVKILQVPGSPLVNPEPLQTLIYDFSGSSYHYNADYSVSTRYAYIINASIDKSFSPKLIAPGGTSTLTFTINNPGADSISNVNFTDDLPNNLNLANANVVYSGCGSPSPTSGSLVDPISFSNITVNGNSSCAITVTVTSSANGTYNNTTSTLKIGTTDTGDTASDTLLVSSAPPPPTTCTPRTTIATWSFENYSGSVDATLDTGPFNASSTVLATTPQGVYQSAGSSVSAIVDRDAPTPAPVGWTIPDADNLTTVWGIRQSWLNAAPGSPFNPSTFTSPFFEFQVNTGGLYGGLGISMDYNLESANGWTNAGQWYILYSTNGSSWSQPQYPPVPTLNGTGSWTKGDWFLPSTPNISGVSDSTSTNVYFRLYFVGAASGGQNANANAYIDNVNITGCLNTAPTPPTISKTFGASPLPVGSDTTLTLTISKTAAANLTGVSFVDVLPSGLDLLSPVVSNSCGGTLSLDTFTDTIQLSGGTLNSASCTIVVNVRGKASGSYTNTTTNITSTESGPNTSTTADVGFGEDPIVVIAPPVINKSFTANPIFTGENTTLNFTINNPNTSSSLTGVGFTDTLPSGLDVVVAAPSSQCGGGTLTLNDANPDTIVLSGGSLAAGTSCSFSVTVTGTTANPAAYTNSVTVSSTNGGNGNTATADVLVKNRTPGMSFAKYVGLSATGPWFKSLNVTLPDMVYYLLVVENTGDVPLNDITVTDPTVSPSTCTWNDGDGGQLSTNNAPFDLPIADTTSPINNQHYATCVIGGVGGITALDGANTNTASADPVELPPSTSQATYTGFAPNLSLTKTDGVSAVTAGGTTTYTLTVTNTGNVTTSGTVTVVESPPAGITVTAISGTGWNCVLATLTCTRSDALAAGNSYENITVSASISATASGTLVNKAKVGGGGDPTNSTAPDAASAAACTGNGTPEGCAIGSNGLNSLTIDKDTSSPNVFVGGTATYTIVVTNTGTTTLTGAVINDTLPGGFTYESTGPITPTGAGTTRTSISDPTVGDLIPSWGTWTIVPGGSVTIPFTARVGNNVTPGTYDNTARVVTNEIPGPTDDDGTAAQDAGTPSGQDPEDDEDVTVAPLADLRLTKTVNNTTPNFGSNVIFTVTVFNDGPSNATGVTVGDLLPAGYTFVSATPSQGSYVSGTGVWTVGAINNGASANIQITATVLATGPYANTAQVTASDQNDPDSTPNNNDAAEDDQATVTVTPGAQIDVSLDKQVSNASPIIGSNVTFTLVIANAGPATATNIVVTDVVPSDFTYVAASIAGGDARSDANPSTTGLTWTINALLRARASTSPSRRRFWRLACMIIMPRSPAIPKRTAIPYRATPQRRKTTTTP